MVAPRTLIRRAAVAGAIAVGLPLAACSGPAAVSPIVGACPDGFADAANAAAVEQGIGVSFEEISPANFEPQAVLSLVTATCFLGFDGEIGANRAEGAFVFATKAIESAAFGAAALALGYEESEANSWYRAESENATEADVLTLSTPSSNGILLDLSELYPEVQHVVASFRVTAG